MILTLEKWIAIACCKFCWASTTFQSMTFDSLRVSESSNNNGLLKRPGNHQRFYCTFVDPLTFQTWHSIIFLRETSAESFMSFAFLHHFQSDIFNVRMQNTWWKWKMAMGFQKCMIEKWLAVIQIMFLAFVLKASKYSSKKFPRLNILFPLDFE